MKALRFPSLVFAAILFLCLTAEPARAQCEIQSVKYLGSVETGAAYAVEVVGQYAYVAGREGLKVVDVSDSLSPQIVGSVSVPAEGFLDFVVSGSHAYLQPVRGYLHIIDISDPENPFIASSLNVFDAIALDVSGSFAYCVDGWDLHVVDISDPSSPAVVAALQLSTADINFVNDIIAVDSYAYVINQGCITTIDISNPLNPISVGNAPTIDRPTAITVQGCNAFVSTYRGIEIFDIAEPTAPFGIGSLNSLWMGYFGWIAVNGDYAFTGNDDGNIIDISDPSAPVLINVIHPGLLAGEMSAVFRDMAFSGNLGYAACAPGSVNEGPGKLQIIDISTTSALPKIHEIEMSGANQVAVDGTFAYVTRGSGQNALDVVDFSDLALPQVVASVSLGYLPYDVCVSGSHAFVVGQAFQVVDISVPTTPQLITTLESGGSAIAVSGNLALITDGMVLNIFDISDPASPTFINSVETSDWAEGVAVSGQYAYVAHWTGLEIIDVSNTMALAVVGSVASPSGFSTRVAVSGDYAYLAGTIPTHGLVIVDVSDPTAPSIVAHADTLGSPVSDLVVAGSYAYLSASYGTPLLIFDIQNPASPVLAGKFDETDWHYWSESGGGLAISDSLAFRAAFDKLQMISLCPTSGGVPAIASSPAELNFTLEQGTSASETIDIWNSGDGVLSYFMSSNTTSGFTDTAYYDNSWIEIEPFSGGSAGEHDQVTLTLRTFYLTPGEHAANIIIADANAGNSPQIIPVSLTVLPVYHTLATGASPAEGGSVTGGGTYTYEQYAIVTAVPNPGWNFDHWEGDEINGRTSNPISMRMSADKSATAFFVPLFSTIALSSPSSGASFSSPPTFTWTCDGSANNAFAVELSYSPDFASYWSLYENAHKVVFGTSWTMPWSIWRQIQPAKTVYWRVRGADLEREPRTIITGGETRWFKKK